MKFNVDVIDVIVILGASLEKSSKISKQSIENVNAFEKMIRDANMKMEIPMILSGGYSKGNKDDTEASLMLSDIIKRGHTFGSIYLETKSRDSSENVQYSLDIIQEHGWKNIIVIDQPLHLFQLKLLFKHYIRLRNLDLDIKIEFIPANPVYGDNVKWWQYSYSLVYFIYLALCTCYYILKRKITLRDII